jgi:hypothetical protein
MISAQGGQVLTFTIIVVNWFSFQFFFHRDTVGAKSLFSRDLGTLFLPKRNSKQKIYRGAEAAGPT